MKLVPCCWKFIKLFQIMHKIFLHMGDDNKCGADNYKLMLALVNPHM